MTEKKLSTLLVFVQDETGSMNSRRSATMSAFNEYFDTLKKDSKDFGKVTVHAWQFSEAAGEDRVRQLHRGTLAKVPKLTGNNYRPRGITPLLDAVGTAMQQADAANADRYLFIVQTDGLENASKDFEREQIAKMVSEKEADDNWTLVFLGAGISEWTKEAMAMGAYAGSTASVPDTPQATHSSYSSLAGQTASLLSSPNTSDKQIAHKVEHDVKNSTSK